MSNLNIGTKSTFQEQPGVPANQQITAAEVNTITGWSDSPSKSLGAFDPAMVFDATGYYDDYNLTSNITISAVLGPLSKGNERYVKINADGVSSISFGTGIAFLVGIEEGEVLPAGVYNFAFGCVRPDEVWAVIPGRGSGGALPKLATPGNLVVTAAGSSSINLNWDASPDATQYSIWRALNSDYSDQSFLALQTGPLSYSDSIPPLNPSTTYYYRVFAQAAGFIASDPAEGSATTNAATTNPEATNVVINGVAGVGITLTGDYVYVANDGGPEATSTYKWYRADDTGGTNEVEIAGATALTYIVQPADLGKVLRFSVVPVGTTLTGTETFSPYTSPVVNPVAAPTLLTSGPVASGSITLEWEDSPDTADSFVLERDTDNAFPSPTQIYSGPLLTATDATAVDNTVYFYRIKAQKSGFPDSTFVIHSETYGYIRQNTAAGDAHWNTRRKGLMTLQGVSSDRVAFTGAYVPANVTGQGHSDGEVVANFPLWQPQGILFTQANENYISHAMASVFDGEDKPFTLVFSLKAGTVGATNIIWAAEENNFSSNRYMVLINAAGELRFQKRGSSVTDNIAIDPSVSTGDKINLVISHNASKQVTIYYNNSKVVDAQTSDPANFNQTIVHVTTGRFGVSAGPTFADGHEIRISALIAGALPDATMANIAAEIESINSIY